MKMVDYQAIAALLAVIETQSFQDAAKKLFITQSAVSQRIKSLESHYGQPVLIRTLPYQPTHLGSMLLDHHRRTMILEDALNAVLLSNYQQKISIAISRDSLETWFTHVLQALDKIPPFLLEIIADDQDVTISYLQNGSVSACASTSAKSFSGCKNEFLGYYDYVLVAAPKFKKKYFSSKSNRDNLIKAQAMIFDAKDSLHTAYLKHYFNISDEDIRYHVVPSVAGFRQFAVNGYAYALIPEIDIKQELRQGKLINLFPDKVWQMPVYWHSWSVETKVYRLFNELVLTIGKKMLRQEIK